MAESKLRSLFHDPEHYVKAFQVFASHSAKYKVLANWGDNTFSNEVVKQLPCKLNENEELRVLGIGSGSGEMESKMLAMLLQKYPRITNCVVEPAVDQIVQYKALVQSKGRELQGVNFDWRQQTMDQYREADSDGAKFHFINAVHSMYYVEDLDSSLTYMYDLLEPGGKLLIITISDDSGTCRLFNRFTGYQDHLMHLISSADVRSSFDRRNIPYTQSQQKSRVEITKFLDETSEDGNLLMDFLIQIVKFKETASDAQYKEVMEYMLSGDCSEKDGDEVLFNNDWDAVIIEKRVP
ncbi:histamine N-methyltransferase-like [Asterias rubens]|uniref:histamine N-methyltransferase-like n=1 Tax=Asterias rubens TaxID=7604 RepID=UPI0014558320|nr:histamine N-methyltransferase-like [Asterias rubens]